MRLCPRTAADMGGATFSQYKDDLVLPKPCVAPTSRKRCVGPSCVGGCEVKQSAESCTACCGGEVEPAMARCVFPFLFAGAKHYTCSLGTDKNGTTGHFCATAVDADLKITEGRAIAVTLAPAPAPAPSPTPNTTASLNQNAKTLTSNNQQHQPVALAPHP